MEIHIQNLGCISNATIDISGLTVLTGYNGSGKSTILKALYSIIHSQESFTQRMNSAVSRYVYSSFEDRFDFIRHYQPLQEGSDKERDSLYDSLFAPFFSASHFQTKTASEWASLISTSQSLVETKKTQDFEPLFRGLPRFLSSRLAAFKSVYLDWTLEALKTLPRISDADNFSKLSFSDAMKTEFNNQISGLLHATPSQISLSDAKQNLFSSAMNGPTLLEFSSLQAKLSDYNIVFYDNPFVLDLYFNDNFVYQNRPSNLDASSFGDFSTGVVPHFVNLVYKLGSPKSSSFEEQLSLVSQKNTYQAILRKVVNENLTKSAKSKYVYGSDEINIMNLATGMKLFVLFQLLLQNNQLNHKTILLLDEPEVYLHPSWQNLFADFLIALKKDLGLNVVVTTHSGNFLLALENSARDSDIPLRVFDSIPSDKNSYSFVDKSQSISDVYSKLAEATFENNERALNGREKGN